MPGLERLDNDSGRFFFGSFLRRLLLHQVPRGRRQAGLRSLHRVPRRLLHSATYFFIRYFKKKFIQLIIVINHV